MQVIKCACSPDAGHDVVALFLVAIFFGFIWNFREINLVKLQVNSLISCRRSALDELAGRGGRGPEDDPLRLTTRGLLQFFRARGREKSLAAAPTDLLPASAVCQVFDVMVPEIRLD